MERSIKALLALRNRIDGLLEEIYLPGGYDKLPLEYWWLEVFAIDLSIASVEKNLRTGKEDYWFNRFGLRKLDKKGEYYKILCRNSM
jgi:hypothetical protein